MFTQSYNGYAFFSTLAEDAENFFTQPAKKSQITNEIADKIENIQSRRGGWVRYKQSPSTASDQDILDSLMYSRPKGTITNSSREMSSSPANEAFRRAGIHDYRSYGGTIDGRDLYVTNPEKKQRFLEELSKVKAERRAAKQTTSVTSKRNLSKHLNRRNLAIGGGLLGAGALGVYALNRNRNQENSN